MATSISRPTGALHVTRAGKYWQSTDGEDQSERGKVLAKSLQCTIPDRADRAMSGSVEMDTELGTPNNILHHQIVNHQQIKYLLSLYNQHQEE